MASTMHFSLRLLYAFSTLSGIIHAVPITLPEESSNLTFAGITFPNTPSVVATHEFVKQHLDAETYNHVIRGIVFSLLIQSKLLADPMQNSKIATADPEIVTVAGLLHDMSWNPYREETKQFVSKDRRFEVDGAFTAREFLTNFTKTSPDGADAGWNERRLQLVWDSIALHGTSSIFAYKEPEVALTGHGIFIDVVGIPNSTFPGVPDKYLPTQEEYDQIYAAIPELDLIEYVTDIFTGLCIVKPATTYDNIVGGFGEEYVPGYNLTGTRFVDIFMARGQREQVQNSTGVAMRRARHYH